MGRRRRMRRVVRRTIKPEMFRCPACHHNSVIIDMNRKEYRAEVRCLECGLHEVLEMDPEEEDIDIYTRFYDAYYE